MNCFDCVKRYLESSIKINNNFQFIKKFIYMKGIFNNPELVLDDSILKFDNDKWQEYLNEEPWKKDQEHYKVCKISVFAALKMYVHGLKGLKNLTEIGTYREVIGYPRGRIVGDTFYVLDSYQVPADATAVEVNLTNESFAYDNKFETLNEEELANYYPKIGWYHSHPGYTPYLSSKDIHSQTQMQKMGPMMALVIDPVNTQIKDSLQIGAFRVYDNEAKNLNTNKNAKLASFEGVPEDKIAEFGLNYKKYYSLKVQYFVTQTDLPIIEHIMAKGWIDNLKNDSLTINRSHHCDAFIDVITKCDKVMQHLQGTETKLDKTILEANLKKLAALGLDLQKSCGEECIKSIAFK